MIIGHLVLTLSYALRVLITGMKTLPQGLGRGNGNAWCASPHRVLAGDSSLYVADTYCLFSAGFHHFF